MALTILGLGAGVLTTGSWLPQVIRAIRTRSTRDLSWIYLLAMASGVVGWLSYGVLRADPAVIAANGTTFVLLLALCATKARTEMTGPPPGRAADGGNTFDAVLFDMDGTLVDSDAVVRRSWAAWAAKHDIDLAHVLRVSPGKPGAQAMAELAPHLTRAQIAADAADLLRREVSDLDGVAAAAGAAELVDAVRASGIGWAVVTSASRALATVRLRACGLPAPPVLITCDDVERGKPDPEGFLRAAALLGAEPSRCVVIEDADAGVRAGLAAGMTVIGTGPRVRGWFAGREGTDPARRDRSRWVNDLTEVSAAPVHAADRRLALRLRTPARVG